MQAMQLKELRGQYKVAKQRLTAEMNEGAQHLLATGIPLGPLPSLNHPLVPQAALLQSILASQEPRSGFALFCCC